MFSYKEIQKDLNSTLTNIETFVSIGNGCIQIANDILSKYPEELNKMEKIIENSIEVEKTNEINNLIVKYNLTNN